MYIFRWLHSGAPTENAMLSINLLLYTTVCVKHNHVHFRIITIIIISLCWRSLFFIGRLFFQICMYIHSLRMYFFPMASQAPIENANNVFYIHLLFCHQWPSPYICPLWMLLAHFTSFLLPFCISPSVYLFVCMFVFFFLCCIFSIRNTKIVRYALFKNNSVLFLIFNKLINYFFNFPSIKIAFSGCRP
jgi:hypothetical protein